MVSNLHFDHSVVQFALPQLLPGLLAQLVQALERSTAIIGGFLAGNRLQEWQKEVQQALLCVLLRLFLDFGDLLHAHHVNRYVHQVAHHGLNIPAYVAHFGKPGCLDF